MGRCPPACCPWGDICPIYDQCANSKEYASDQRIVFAVASLSCLFTSPGFVFPKPKGIVVFACYCSMLLLVLLLTARRYNVLSYELGRD